MTKSKVEYIKLVASEGMLLTNGKIYCKVVYLAENDNADNWREITIEEYKR